MFDRQRILIVDDDRAVREAYCDIFVPQERDHLLQGDRLFGNGRGADRAGAIQTYDIDQAEDGEQAVQKVQGAVQEGMPFGVAFVDMKMPGMNGAETAREIWRIDPRIKIVIVTAYSDVTPDEIVEMVDREDLFYLRKPFSPHEIKQFARALCRQRALEDERDRLAADLKEANLSLEAVNRVLEDKVKTQAEMLIQMDKMASIGQHAAELVHDLRNPLSVVRTTSQFCLESMKLDRLLKEHFEVIDRNARRASELINEVLAFARTGTVERDEVDLNEVIKAMLRKVQQMTPSVGIEYELQLEEGLPPVIGDADKLGQVFLNLILNAIQALAGHGKITLRSQVVESPNQVQGCVMDNGPAIPEEHREKMFDPFFTTKKRGTGLGLSICHSIVTQHGGSITVDEGDGQGVNICVRLPVKSDEEE